MKLVEFVPPRPHRLWKLCPQMGIDEVVVKVHPSLTGIVEPWKHENLKRTVDGLAEAGLRVVALEGDPFDVSAIKLGTAGRDEAIGHYLELLESMARCGIRLLCYNFMAGEGWHRTGVKAGRGGAMATYFSLAETPESFGGPVLAEEEVWANWDYFAGAVLPKAEELGIRMGLHPDDPPLRKLGGMARVFNSADAFDRAYAMHPCEANAVTFCQANFTLMGEDLRATARRFGKRIAYVHCRDVEGDAENFAELFHDQGKEDQFALFRLYRELGVDVPVRGDHVPAMAGEEEEGGFVPGYGTLGRLFANGYIKAVMQAAERGQNTARQKMPEGQE